MSATNEQIVLMHIYLIKYKYTKKNKEKQKLYYNL